MSGSRSELASRQRLLGAGAVRRQRDGGAKLWRHVQEEIADHPVEGAADLLAAHVGRLPVLRPHGLRVEVHADQREVPAAHERLLPLLPQLLQRLSQAVQTLDGVGGPRGTVAAEHRQHDIDSVGAQELELVLVPLGAVVGEPGAEPVPRVVGERAAAVRVPDALHGNPAAVVRLVVVGIGAEDQALDVRSGGRRLGRRCGASGGPGFWRLGGRGRR